PDPTLATGRIALEGDIPSPLSPPSGCVFRARCPQAIEACAQTVPSLDEISPGHYSACIRKELRSHITA
ncbi:peptide ABC transporter ATP-binding protein, partial [Verminephrobacter sp. Larva24]